MNKRRKVFFDLEQDESGYPPVATESLWAIPTENSMEYVLDNIPFFERVATIGDKIRVEEVAGRIWYRATIGRTSHSLIRIVGLDDKDPISVGRELEQMGCSWELDVAHHLIAVDVPHEVLDRARALLAQHAISGEIDYEEAILR
ncbi:MAG: DUF4265 domain-containing protein [Byssovorax sp.]